MARAGPGGRPADPDGHRWQALAVSPYTGKLLGQIDLPSPTHLPPIVANGTVYILSDNADLTALR